MKEEDERLSQELMKQELKTKDGRLELSPDELVTEDEDLKEDVGDDDEDDDDDDEEDDEDDDEDHFHEDNSSSAVASADSSVTPVSSSGIPPVKKSA